ncbi:TonB-dependent receptor [Pigmentiphaga humi]|uniref:TonB-dependent receptor n=1 Tax=Pigmentiphaga humi TaxID=2478468 RepID=UPI000F52656E|nr:TonB-dependent receptor [Pigmentiphaga humi]
MPRLAGPLSAALHRRLRPAAFAARLGLGALVLAHAAGTPTWAQADVQARRHYAIEAGSLNEVLGRFGELAGVMIAADPALTFDARSPGLRGNYTVAEGLEKLLSDRGLEAVPAGGGYRLQRRPPPPVPAPAPLAPVLVVGLRDKTEDAHHAAASEHVITREQMDRVQATSARDIFAETPGVWVMNGRQNPSLNVNIRGLQDSTRINMMVDGARQGLQIVSGHSGVNQFVFVDPELLADVSIAKGPTSGAHGAAQIGGVVDLRTLEADDLLRDGQTQAFRVRGTVGNSGYGASGSAAAAFRLDERWDLATAVSRRRSDDYKAGTSDPGLYSVDGTLDRSRVRPGDEVYGTSQDLWSGLFKAGLRLDGGHQIKLGATYYENTYGQQGANRALASNDPDRTGTDGGPPRGRMQTRGRDNQARATTYTAKYSWTPAGNPWIDLRANLWRSSTHVRRPEYDTAYKTTSWGMELYNTSRFDVPVLGSARLTYGTEYFEDDGGTESLKTDLTRNPDVAINAWAGELTGSGKRRVGSLFTELTLMHGDWLEVTGGLRRDIYNMQGDGYYMSPVSGQGKAFFTLKNRETHVSPRLTLAVMPASGVQLYAAYHEGFRPPAIAEAMLSGTHGNVLQFNPNPNLKPEYARNRELGASFTFDGVLSARDKLRAKAAYFANRVDGFIDYGEVSNYLGTYTTFVNLDRAYFQGTEWSLSYDNGSAFLQASYTYFSVLRFCTAGVCSDNVGGIMGSPFIPSKEKMALTAGVRLFDRAVTLGARVRRDGRRAAANDDSAGFGNVQTFWPAYTVYDLFGSVQLNRSTQLGFSIENLRDTYYIDALGSDLVPGPGRVFKALLTMNF